MARFVLATWLAIICAGVWHSSGKLRTIADGHWNVLTTPPFAELDTALINVVTLGHRGLYDDFINIWAIQFLFDERLKHESPTDVQKAVLQITRHHPKLESLYIASCYLLYLEFARPDLCEEIILDGLKAFPLSWRIPVAQAFMYGYVLKQWDQSASYYALAASKPKSPPFIKKLIPKIMDERRLSIDDITNTLKSMSNDDGGSKLSEFLNELHKRRQERKSQ
jgi:hypothetical protein